MYFGKIFFFNFDARKKISEYLINDFIFKIYLSPGSDDLELYKRMVSYVMAYSFTEPPNDVDSEVSGEEDLDEEEEEKAVIYMVPMADMLNHIAKNNAHLSFKPDCLEMIATKDIKKVGI